MSGPKSMSSSSLRSAAERFLRLFPPSARAAMQFLQLQKGSGKAFAAEVPRNVNFMMGLEVALDCRLTLVSPARRDGSERYFYCNQYGQNALRITGAKAPSGANGASQPEILEITIDEFLSDIPFEKSLYRQMEILSLAN